MAGCLSKGSSRHPEPKASRDPTGSERLTPKPETGAPKRDYWGVSAYLAVPCSRCRRTNEWAVHQRNADGAVIRRCACGAWEQHDPATGRWNQYAGPSLRDPITEQQ